LRYVNGVAVEVIKSRTWSSTADGSQYGMLVRASQANVTRCSRERSTSPAMSQRASSLRFRIKRRSTSSSISRMTVAAAVGYVTSAAGSGTSVSIDARQHTPACAVVLHGRVDAEASTQPLASSTIAFGPLRMASGDVQPHGSRADNGQSVYVLYFLMARPLPGCAYSQRLHALRAGLVARNADDTLRPGMSLRHCLGAWRKWRLELTRLRRARHGRLYLDAGARMAEQVRLNWTRPSTSRRGFARHRILIRGCAATIWADDSADRIGVVAVIRAQRPARDARPPLGQYEHSPSQLKLPKQRCATPPPATTDVQGRAEDRRCMHQVCQVHRFTEILSQPSISG